MSKLHNYVPNQFSQINLDDGSKVLVSLAEDEMKIYLLGFFGSPKETLHTFDSLAVSRIYHLYNDVLEFVSSQLLLASSVEEITDKCESIENFLKTLPAF